MHVKLVSCFALCWKLPLWTISLELATQSDRFGIMWHSTMILRILLCGVIEWGNIRHIGSQGTFNSTRSPPPAEISVQHIAATITQFLQRFKAWNWVCSSRTRQYRNFDTPKNCPPHCFRYYEFQGCSSQVCPTFAWLRASILSFYMFLLSQRCGLCADSIQLSNFVVKRCNPRSRAPFWTQQVLDIFAFLNASQPQKSRARHGMAK